MKQTYKMKSKSASSVTDKDPSFIKSMLKFKRTKERNIEDENAITLRRFSMDKHKITSPRSFKNTVNAGFDDVYEEINLENHPEGSIAESDEDSNGFKQNRTEESENENENISDQVNVYDDYDVPVSIDEQNRQISKSVVEKNSSASLDRNKFTKFNSNNDYMKPSHSFSIPKITFNDFSANSPSDHNKTNLENNKNFSLDSIRTLSLNDSFTQMSNNQSKKKHTDSSVSNRSDLIKRRTMLGVIKAVDKTKNKTKPNELASSSNLSFVSDKYENDNASRNQIKRFRSDSVFFGDITTRNKANNSGKNLKHENSRGGSKLATGISIIYGIFLLFLGIFLSLDTYVGKLGVHRYVNTLFLLIVYLIGIFWIIFLFVDIRRYVSKLEALLSEEQREDVNEIVRNKSNNGFYSVVNTKTGNLINIYESSQEILRDLDKKKYLVDHTKKGFKGYLVDTYQPYNMYLRIGIGIFCLVTLIQCVIDMAEAVENKIYGKSGCIVESYDAIIASLQFVFSCLQFLFIFLRGNIVISSNNVTSSILTMHIAVINIIVWFKSILIETSNEFYEHLLDDNLEIIETFFKNQTSSILFIENKTIKQQKSDCYDSGQASLKEFALTLKPYMIPATIEFSITCATIFLITWSKIGKTNIKHLSLPPCKENFRGVGKVNMPFMNNYIMLDCTSTARGLFFGILIFTGTVTSYVLYVVYKSDNLTKDESRLISELAELSLLLIALVLTCFTFIKIRKHYTKVKPELNMFDIVLEVVSLGGVFIYCINSMIAVLYNLGVSNNEKLPQNNYLDFLKPDMAKSNMYAAPSPSNGSSSFFDQRILSVINSVLSIVQCTVQTCFILECLRRYANENKAYMRKPGRNVITALLLINVCMWFFDTFSAKRFDTKPFLIEHFGILKWSIITAISSPLAIFYRFHSSVCLSDIWYGLYYGEHEGNDNSDDESENRSESSA